MLKNAIYAFCAELGPYQEQVSKSRITPKGIFMTEKFCILIKISLRFVPEGSINNNPALV